MLLVTSGLGAITPGRTKTHHNERFEVSQAHQYMRSSLTRL